MTNGQAEHEKAVTFIDEMIAKALAPLTEEVDRLKARLADLEKAREVKQ